MKIKFDLLFLLFACGLLLFLDWATQKPKTVALDAGIKILRELHQFRQMGSVLYIAAHPDDEENQLLAYLSRGRFYRTAYLSLTRGDGGQNVLGADFGDSLGVLRTQELMAGRHIDGASQFFSRAVDFGFSKDYRQTLQIWDKQGVLSDVVRVIRTFRPDVLVTRFSPVPGGTHGHHTASTVLAMEAFKLAGDPTAFPDQLTTLKPWQPKRILWNAFGGGDGTQLASIDVGGLDPLSGEPFGDIAGYIRSFHKTQGAGVFKPSGVAKTKYEIFKLLDGTPAATDIMDDADTTWNRVPGGSVVGDLADKAINQFDLQDPTASVPMVLNLRSELAKLPGTDPTVIEKQAELDRILQDCLGLKVETTLPKPEVVPGESLLMNHLVSIRANTSVRLESVSYPGIGAKESVGIDLSPSESSDWNSTQVLPSDTPLSQPYWLRKEKSPGMFQVDDPALIGTPVDPPVFPIKYTFIVGGETLVISDEPREASAPCVFSRHLEVIPPVSLHMTSNIALMAPGASHSVEVELTSARDNLSGTVQLEIPDSWKVDPAQQPFHLATAGQKERFEFTITAPLQSASAKIIASAKIGGMSYQTQHIELNYSHLPPQLLQPVASFKAVSLNLTIRGKTVGYLPGAGDSVAEALRQMGYEVRELDDQTLTADQLKGLDAVVIGIRALNVRATLPVKLPLLSEYVKEGGTIIAQYYQPTKTPMSLVPYNLNTSTKRVTDINAVMTFLNPNSPIVNMPNKITAADFQGWIQERGTYFADQWDTQFTPIFACNDPGEAPLQGGLLVATYGKGHFIYTGLSFFRQLPAGVPGAYRLFANLVSIGK